MLDAPSTTDQFIKNDLSTQNCLKTQICQQKCQQTCLDLECVQRTLDAGGTSIDHVMVDHVVVE